jgi:hypothetical protein
MSRLDVQFLPEDLETLTSWLQETVYASLRNGYWERDLTTDTLTPGFTGFLAALYRKGGEMVFVSNRSPDMRTASITVISRALREASDFANMNIPLFAYFGPGGSRYDAKSKEAAQQHIEANPIPAVYFGTVQGNQVTYNAPTDVSQDQVVVVSVFDDRSASRNVMVAAASKSTALKTKYQLSPIASIGIAVVKHCPEIMIVEASNAIVTFELEQKSYSQKRPTDMDTKQTRDRVKELIGRELLANDEEMATLNTDFGTLMIFKEFLEIEFNLLIEPSDLSNCRTVADVIGLVEKLQANQPKDDEHQ